MKAIALVVTMLVLNSAHAIQAFKLGPNVSPKGDIPVQRALTAIDEDGIEEFNPEDPEAEEILKAYDEYYEQMTGKSPFIEGYGELFTNVSGCYRDGCPVWIYVSIAEQTAYLTLDGRSVASWKVSSARKGYRTKRGDFNPNGRVYDYYESKRYPGGGFKYKGRRMGNMGFAVFYYGGYALHGTAAIKNLGRPASHGCVRQHPEHAEYFNQLVRHYGKNNVWITVQ